MLSMQSVHQEKSNQRDIYQLVYNIGPLARPEIARRLGVSLPTVMQWVKELMSMGLLEEGAPLPSTGGRKAIGIQCVANARVSLGIDITKEHVSLVVTNLKSEILAHMRTLIPFSTDREYWNKLRAMVDTLIVEAGISTNRYLGIGISCPGIISKDGKTLTYSHVLNGASLQSTLAEQFLEKNCILCNDANAAAIAEMWNVPSEQTSLYLSLSDTVGGAVMLGEHPLWGQHGRCGEFGHVTLMPHGTPCYCGRNGCMDAYCNATLLSRHTDGNLELFFEKLRQNDKKLDIVWQRYLEWLAIAVNNLITSYDSPIILGGYVGEYIEPYLPQLRALLSQRTTFAWDEKDIRPCRYKKEAAAVGAALLWVAPFLSQI